ncbi:glycosyltransferase family 2 protein [Devosia sp.]
MQAVTTQSQQAPRISVIMANFEAGAKIVSALQSVLGQTMADLEVIVCDDASRDNSLEFVRAMMAHEPRLRLIANQTNRGPAHCRNCALAEARGEWVAVVDSDDIIHPERFERLLAAAAQHDADIVADNLLLFHEDGTPARLLLGEQKGGSFDVSTTAWILAGIDGSPALGYLKPMIRRDRLDQMRYDEDLRIGEDYDFVLRLLLAEARMLVVGEPFYLYRRHSGSISHRLSVPDMQVMVARQAALASQHDSLSAELLAAFATRLASLKAGLSYEQLVSGIKQRQLTQSARLLLAEPALLGRLWTSLMERRQRHTSPDRPSPRPGLLVLAADDMPGVDQIVPDYVPASEVDWSAPQSHSLWRDLAGHAKGRCVALDKAGQYAAGFIPEVTLESRPALREAS